ncbi:MAG: hypothetical protein HYZ75_03905 [Elusimicrobia bacterium]|nr:hypothetical protein [Elusimicrobiota bacterium]
MKCPNCSAETPDAAPECGACGVIFAKWKPRAEEPVAPPPPPASKIPLVLLGAAVLGAAGYGYYAYAARPAEQPVEVIGANIPPEPYKPQIRAIEIALYKNAVLTPNDATVIDREASRLAGFLAARHPEHPFVRKAVADIMEFSAAAGAVENGAFPPNARTDWTRGWEALRSKRFAPAPWFRQIALEAKKDSQAPPAP